jgi:hypothetical protein
MSIKWNRLNSSAPGKAPQIHSRFDQKDMLLQKRDQQHTILKGQQLVFPKVKGAEGLSVLESLEKERNWVRVENKIKLSNHCHSVQRNQLSNYLGAAIVQLHQEFECHKRTRWSLRVSPWLCKRMFSRVSRPTFGGGFVNA